MKNAQRDVNKHKLKDLIAVARGDRIADIILKNARIVNTFTGCIENGNVAIYQDRIAGIGYYSKGKQIIDLAGNYLAPGLINGHTHIESSMLDPVQYAKTVVPRGTSVVVTDVHEIANVSGIKGIQFVMDCAANLPMDMFFMVPSCVPATTMETSGGEIDENAIKTILAMPNVLGLGEMMNFPGVINGIGHVLDKIKLAAGKVIDGHSPGVIGELLNAYVAPGISSDHECTTLEEGIAKLNRGMYLMIREGSSAKNLDVLLPLVNDLTYKRCMFVVDDRNCFDLIKEGDIDAVVRKAIKRGLDPIRAIQMATINAAEHFRLRDRGGIAPGYKANIISFEDLENIRVDKVFHNGKLVADQGRMIVRLPECNFDKLAHTINIKTFTADALRLKIRTEIVPVIEIVPGQITTKKIIVNVKTENGYALNDIDNDIIKLVVIERHKATGNIGLGLVKGFKLQKGALASSIAHDSHNVVAIGVTDSDIMVATKEIEKMQGGLTVVCDGKILASLPLPIAGLLSPEPVESVADKLNQMEIIARGLGDIPQSPFTLLSFLALPVIPELKLTDKGLVDVNEFRIVEL